MTGIEREIEQAVRWLNQQANMIPYGSVGVTFVMHAGAVVKVERSITSKIQPGEIGGPSEHGVA
ncbi:MAG: hypothetical protein ABSF77_19850 [Spirochaetia bacterium]|jgi:hypothetical protein